MSVKRVGSIAERIIYAANTQGEREPMALLEHVYGRAGDAALLLALAHWGYTLEYGAPPETMAELEPIAAELSVLLGWEAGWLGDDRGQLAPQSSDLGLELPDAL